MKTKIARMFMSRGAPFLGKPFRAALMGASLAVAACFPGCRGSGMVQEAGYAPGVYEGSGRGYRGPLRVRVQVSPAGIEDIAIVRHEERYPGAAALEELREAVLESGSADLDAVSGATFSSRGFLEAVEAALDKARN